MARFAVPVLEQPFLWALCAVVTILILVIVTRHDNGLVAMVGLFLSAIPYKLIRWLWPVVVSMYQWQQGLEAHGKFSGALGGIVLIACGMLALAAIVSLFTVDWGGVINNISYDIEGFWNSYEGFSLWRSFVFLFSWPFLLYCKWQNSRPLPPPPPPPTTTFVPPAPNPMASYNLVPAPNSIFYHGGPKEAVWDIYNNRRVKYGGSGRGLWLSTNFQTAADVGRVRGGDGALVLEFRLPAGVYIDSIEPEVYVLPIPNGSKGSYYYMPDIIPVGIYDAFQLKVA